MRGAVFCLFLFIMVLVNYLALCDLDFFNVQNIYEIFCYKKVRMPSGNLLIGSKAGRKMYKNTSIKQYFLQDKLGRAT